MSTDGPERYRRIKETFAEARELSGAARERFLDAACEGEAELRQEVEALLSSDEEGVEGPLGKVLLEEPERRADASLPQRIANFRIIRICGSGGMGTVYEAEQDSPRRRVALKVIQASNMRPDLLSRFKRETEILGRLQHPGIAQVYDAGEYERDGGTHPYYAMEFIDGDSILEFVQSHKLSVAERVEMFRKVCEAMQYAHEHGVVHRDLKPDNVLVQRTHGTTSAQAPSLGQPKVLDFGVAQLTDADLAATLATRTGQLIGSIPYMSPEQAAADGRPVDHRADVYSLGILLFELLTNKLPYDVSRSSLPEAIETIMHRDPERLGSVDPALRGDLETVAGKCLEKDADRRYPSVAALVGDLELYAQHKPITARPPSTWYQVSRFAKRHRAFVGGTCATMIASVVGMIVAIVFAFRASENEDLANANQNRAARQAYRANLAASSALLATDPLAARRRLEDTPEEERGWEWSYLSSLLDGKLVEFGGEMLESRFGDVEVFASGTRVVSQISPLELGIFDTRTGERVRTLEAQRPVVTIGIADDGRLLAVGRDDGGVDVIEPTKGDEWVNWLPAEEGSRIVRVDVAPGGEHVAVARGEEILQVTRGEARVLLTAENPIPRRNDVEYSEDGQFLAALATGAHLRKFQIFEVSTLEKRLPEPFHVAGAMDVALSPDGNRFAIAHEQRRVTVGHVADPSDREEFFAHNKVVRSVEFREDGSLLTVSDDQSARVWDLEEGELVRHIPLENLRDVAFAADDTLVSSSPTGLALWRVSEPRAITLTGFEDYLYDLAFSPSGRVLASTSLVQGVCVWDVHTGRALHEHAGSTGPIGVSFDVPGEHVLQPGFPADALYDWASGQESQSPSPLPFRVAHQGDRVHVDDRSSSKALSQEFEIWRVDHSENGARLFVDGDELALEGASETKRAAGSHPVLTIGSPRSLHDFDGDLAEIVVLYGQATSDQARTIEAYLAARRLGGGAVPPLDLGGERLVAHFRVEEESVEVNEHEHLLFWRDRNDPGRRLKAFGATPYLVKLGAEEDPGPRHVKMMESFDGSRFLEVSLPELVGHSHVTVFALVRPRDTYGYRPIFYTIGTPTLPFREFAARVDPRLSNVELYGPEGAWHIQGMPKSASELWVRDGETGALLRTLGTDYHCVALNAVDHRLACGSETGRVDIYDTETWSVLHTLEAHSSRAYAVDWSPDGKRLATGGNDNQIRLWDAESYEPLLELSGHDSYVKAVRFSPDGTMLGSASGDHTVRVWDTVTPSERYARRLEEEKRERAVHAQVAGWWKETRDATNVLQRIEATWASGDPNRHAARVVLSQLRR